MNTKPPALISEIQQRKIIHLFNVLDLNKNGMLQLDDFVHVGEEIIHQLKLEKDSRAARLILIKANRLFVQLLIDTNQPDFQIGVWDWLNFFKNALSDSPEAELINHFIHRTNYHLFALFDLNGDRKISPEEYANMWSIYHLNRRDCEKSFSRIDKNSDQLISVDEMIAALHDFFYSDDIDASGNLIFGDWT